MLITPEQSNRPATPVQVPHSALQLIDSTVHWLTFTSYSYDPKFKPEHQPIMCDFDFVQTEVKSSFFVTLVLAMENKSKADNRLAFSMSTVTEFEFKPGTTPEPLPEDPKKLQGILMGGLSTAIGTARGYLATYLAHTTYSNYVLPLIEVEALFNSKYNRPEMPDLKASVGGKKRGRKPGSGLKDIEIKPNDDLT